MTVSLTCTARRTDRYARPVGDPCGTTWTGVTLDHARVTGWRVGPPGPDGRRDGLCPQCVHGPSDTEPECPSPELAAVQLDLFPL